MAADKVDGTQAKPGGEVRAVEPLPGIELDGGRVVFMCNGVPLKFCEGTRPHVALKQRIIIMVERPKPMRPWRKSTLRSCMALTRGYLVHRVTYCREWYNRRHPGKRITWDKALWALDRSGADWW